MSKITIEGKQLFYSVKGKGEPLLFLHMSLSNHHQWKPLFSLDSKAKLVLVDLPGHGESDSIEGEISVPRLTKIMAQFITDLALDRIIPVGHSLGGAIALQLALDHPHLLKGLILLGTGAKLGVYPAILKGLQIDFEAGVGLVVGQMCFAKGANPQTVESVVSECLQCEPTVGYADLVACNNFDVRDRLGEIDVPTLVVVGEEDQLTPVKWAQFLSERIPNADLRIIKNAGHMVMVEQPSDLIDTIRTFLNSL